MTKTTHPGINLDRHLAYVGTDDLLLVWPYVTELIDKALNQGSGEYRQEDIYLAVLEQEMQLWIGLKGNEVEMLAVTQIVKYPSNRVTMSIVFLAGENLSVWLGELDTLEEWARSQGAQGVEFHCRPGFQRILDGYGYEKERVVLQKNLED